MTGPALRTAWYRFRVTFRRRWAGYLALALLTGLVGGVAMGSMIAARRTYASYPKFLASTNPSDLVVQPFTKPPYSPAFVAQLAALPHVQRATVAVTFGATTLTPRGKPGTVLLSHVQLAATASQNGLFSGQDRVTIIAGHAANPARPDEVVASSDAAALLRLHVGSHLTVGVFSNSQKGGITARPRLTVVGVGVFNAQVLQDGIDAGRTGFLLGTPALAREFGSCCSNGMIAGLRLGGGSRYDAAVDKEYQHLLASSALVNSSELQIYITSAIEAQAQRAIRPEAIALGVFGLIAGLAALIIGAQSISRQLRAGADDTGILRALGAGPAAIMADGLAGIVGAVAAGSLLATAVAIGLSPFSLFGPVRAVDASPGADLDWTVLGLGALALTAVLGGAGAVIAYRQAPHRVAARELTAGHGSRVLRVALGAGMSASAVAGVRLALEPGRGRTAVPVRSVVTGAVLTMAVVTATLTFGASLSTLISHPDLYGWNFDYALYAVQGWGPVPTTLTGPLLAGDRAVAATTGVYFTTMQVDGQTVGTMLAPPRPAVAPRILSGHGLDSSRQIVLGTATLAELHKKVGDVVTVAGGDFHARLRIAGTATMPTIGTVLSLHPSMSTGALFSTAAFPAGGLNSWGSLSGPNAVFVRLRPGISEAAGLRSLHRVVQEVNQRLNSPRVLAATHGLSTVFTVDLLAAQRPAEIVNYRSMGAMPAILAGGLAAGAVAGLGLTLIASVRRRRRDFALLKTLGFTRRQLAGAVAWQSTVIAVAGLVIGVPLGIAAGRWLWLLFARELSAVPDPVIPASSIALAALAALILANLVAALPGRHAARTPAALLLRAE